MNPMDEFPNETFSIPSSAAEAWAEVYLDIAEKLDAETLASCQTQTTPKEEPMVTEYITCDAIMNFPVPTIDMLVERISQMYDGQKPVSAKAIAASFKQDVEVYQTRMALKALVATLPTIDQEIALVQQKIAAADRELEAAEQRYEDTTAPLYGRLREINEVQKEISQAR
jgi:hypothetical protein